MFLLIYISWAHVTFDVSPSPRIACITNKIKKKGNSSSLGNYMPLSNIFNPFHFKDDIRTLSDELLHLTRQFPSCSCTKRTPMAQVLAKPLTSQHPKQEKEAVVTQHKPRFNKQGQSLSALAFHRQAGAPGCSMFMLFR